ncbi:MAG: 2-oxo-4-hydroxy-4-carboxy-5-ureidoimidazoline decarboxylase [Ectothiorhodospiraceae bacterium]|nr:2-oxo-4-hydroxy-4-carboxy-5-ureidoimidazoline decarboxylase [Ectothiorhodospiraceae bacterium]
MVDSTSEGFLSPRPSSLSRSDFIASYGGIYEHSPWVAEAAWDSGLGEREDTADGLAGAMARALEAADTDRQLELIRAHPDLAGKAAVAGELTADSSSEQASAGLDQCRAEEFERFQRLNAEYKERFRFPFVMAVRGQDRHAILAAFERRLSNSPEEERRTAIEQINRIALLRLHERVAAG